MNKLVCIAGLCGAGKSIVSQYFIEAGFSYLHIGEITMDILKERKLAINESNEKLIRESLRKEYGMAAYAELNIEKMKKLLQFSHVVADGLYSFSEYQVLKNIFGTSCIVVAVYAPPQTRYERLNIRPVRPLTPKEASERDISELSKLEKGGPIAMADITLTNISSLQAIKEKTEEVIHAIQNT